MMHQSDESDAAALDIKIITPSSPEKPPVLGGIWHKLHCICHFNMANEKHLPPLNSRGEGV